MYNSIASAPNTVAASRYSWQHVVGLLLGSRVILSLVAFFAANRFPLEEGINAVTAPTTFPNVWVRFDAGFYLSIAQNGYNYLGEELAFFPLYSVIVQIVSLGNPGAMTWVGFVISNLAFVGTGLLLWQQTRLEFGEKPAWAAVVSLAVFPTSFFLSAFYPESLFLFFSVLVYWSSARKRYGWAAFFVVVGSLTRITGYLLIVIPLVEIWLHRPPRMLFKMVQVFVLSSLGLGLFGLYLWVTHDHPLVFIEAQSMWGGRWAWPWETIWNSFNNFLTGGPRDGNWFIRLNSLQDFLAAVLFLAALVGSFFLLRKSLFLYMGSVMLLLTIAHGPYDLGLWSVSRNVIVLFPGYIVFGIWLARFPRLKWLIWSASALILVFLTGWFATGRWVA